MLAMQYNFVLPADYDMSIVHRRIATRGRLMDDFPRLVFKAYLSANRQSPDLPSTENAYAPFYLWADGEGMSAFLCGDGFAGLTRDFGWPSVDTWHVWQSNVSPRIAGATCASREVVTIPRYASLAGVRAEEDERASHDVHMAGASGGGDGFRADDVVTGAFPPLGGGQSCAGTPRRPALSRRTYVHARGKRGGLSSLRCGRVVGWRTAPSPAGGSVEANDLADRRAVGQAIEGGIDVVQGQSAREQAVHG